LWHQLTETLKAAVYNPAFTQQVNLLELQETVIHAVEHRINPLQLVEIVILVANFIFAKDQDASFDFLKNIEKSIAKDQLAAIRLETAEIELRLQCKDTDGRCMNIQQIREMVEKTRDKLDLLHGVTPVHAAFYRASSQYLKEVGNYEAYYNEALRYLGCEDLEKLSSQERHQHALLLGIAALLGNNVYNFGQLLAHPILGALEGTNEAWLIEVLFAFNSGDLEKFRQHKREWSVYTDVVNNQERLEAKIRILCLMEIAAGRPSKQRSITFDEIAKRTQVDMQEVEFLVMRALSKGLLRGSIDEVAKTVSITWVQPRVLSRNQIKEVSGRVGEWNKGLKQLSLGLDENAAELLIVKK